MVYAKWLSPQFKVEFSKLPVIIQLGNMHNSTMESALLYSILPNILNPANNLSRTQAESHLLQLYQSAPEDTLNLYLHILHSQNIQIAHHMLSKQFNPNTINQFIALQLRFCLRTYPRLPYRPLWHKLSSETQERFKIQLFELLLQKGKQQIFSYIAEVIGNLAANLIVQDNQIWPQFKHKLQQIATTQGNYGLSCALIVLQSFYCNQVNNYKQVFPQLPALLAQSFKNQRLDVRYLACKCLASYLLVLDHERHRQYQNLIPNMIEVAQLMIAEGSNAGLQILVYSMQDQPKFFKANFNLIIDFFTKINDSTAAEHLKTTATEAIVDYCSTYPSLFRSDPPAISLIIDMVIMRMLNLPNQIPESWIAPQEGFDASYSNQPQAELIEPNLQLLNRVIKAVGKEPAIAKIRANVEQLLSMGIWSYQYAAMMVVAQLGEYISHIQGIQTYIAAALDLFGHQNPKLRYAAVHAIGLLSSQCKRSLKTSPQYSSCFMQRLWELLTSQPCPRVISHIFSAYSNLLQQLPSHITDPYFDSLFATIIDCLTNGISLVKESALTALSSLAETSKLRIAQKLELIFHTVSKYFYENEYLSPCYNKLRGYALQCMSIMAVILQKDVFKEYLPPFVTMLTHLLSEHFSKFIPPNVFILDCWNRLGLAFGVQLEEYVGRFFPDMLAIITQAVLMLKGYYERQQSQEQPGSSHLRRSQQPQQEPEEGQLVICINQVQLGIKLISTLLQLTNDISFKYFEEIMAIYVNILHFSPDQDLKEQVFKAVPCFIAELNPLQLRDEIGRSFLQVLGQLIDNKKEPTLLQDKLKTISRILGLFDQKIREPFITQQLSYKVLNILLSSDSSKASIMQRAVGYDQDEMLSAQVKLQHEDEIQSAAIEVMGELFSLYGEELKQLGDRIIRQFLGQLFVEGQRPAAIQNGLLLLDDLLQYLGQAHLQKYRLWIPQILENYIPYKRCQIRQAAVFGLGLFAEQHPLHPESGEEAGHWLQLLRSAYTIDKGKGESKRRYTCCQDNVIAAMGRIIQSHIKFKEVHGHLQFWLSHLPLWADSEESALMAEFVAVLVLKYPQLMCESDGRVLQLLKAVGMMSRAEESRFLLRELKKCLGVIMGCRILVERGEDLSSLLEPDVRQALSQLSEMDLESSSGSD